MPLDDLPAWLPAWCADQLGSEPDGVLFQVHQVSTVFGLRLRDGRDVVVKARADDGRAASCVAAQDLRWHGRPVWAVHDWDSLAWQPEAALVGAASGAFASAGPPVLAPIESSEAFLLAYQDARGRVFDPEELEIAWAASLWMAAYNLWEGLGGALSVDAFRAQAAERLRRADA